MLLTNIFCSYRSHMGCNKEFNRPDKLKAHILSHSGECSWPLPVLLVVGSEVAEIPCGCVGVWYGSKPEKREGKLWKRFSCISPEVPDVLGAFPAVSLRLANYCAVLYFPLHMVVFPRYKPNFLKYLISIRLFFFNLCCCRPV